MSNPYDRSQMHLVMDQAGMPQQIKDVFMLSEVQGGWNSGLALDVCVPGEEIDLNCGGYVIVYASNTWHLDKAVELWNQIKSLRPNAQIVMLPVDAEVKQQSYTHTFSPIDLSAWNPVPFPGKP